MCSACQADGQTVGRLATRDSTFLSLAGLYSHNRQQELGTCAQAIDECDALLAVNLLLHLFVQSRQLRMNSKVRSMPLAKKELEELHNAEHCALLHGGSGIFVIVHALYKSQFAYEAHHLQLLPGAWLQ